jgi:hypothetical protein
MTICHIYIYSKTLKSRALALPPHYRPAQLTPGGVRSASRNIPARPSRCLPAYAIVRAVQRLIEIGWLAPADRGNRDAVTSAVVRLAAHAAGLGPRIRDCDAHTTARRAKGALCGTAAKQSRRWAIILGTSRFTSARTRFGGCRHRGWVLPLRQRPSHIFCKICRANFCRQYPAFFQGRPRAAGGIIGLTFSTG